MEDCLPQSGCHCMCHDPDWGMHVKHVAPCCYPEFPATLEADELILRKFDPFTGKFRRVKQRPAIIVELPDEV